MKRICVFAGSNSGSRIEYLAAARELGHALVRRELGLVYGGARVGLMGAVADAVLAAGGHVTGVIPEALVAKEVAHEQLSDLPVVASIPVNGNRVAGGPGQRGIAAAITPPQCELLKATVVRDLFALGMGQVVIAGPDLKRVTLFAPFSASVTARGSAVS